jgi:hypothetical protein
MSDCTARKRTRQIEMLRTQFAQADGLAFAEVLPAERVETAFSKRNCLPVLGRILLSFVLVESSYSISSKLSSMSSGSP